MKLLFTLLSEYNGINFNADEPVFNRSNNISSCFSAYPTRLRYDSFGPETMQTLRCISSKLNGLEDQACNRFVFYKQSNKKEVFSEVFMAFKMVNEKIAFI
jgi:hypothetical protein